MSEALLEEAVWIGGVVTKTDLSVLHFRGEDGSSMFGFRGNCLLFGLLIHNNR